MLSRVLALCAVLGMVGVLAADDAIDYGPLPPPQQPEFEAVLKLPQIIRDAEVVPVASLDTELAPSDKQAELERKLQQAAELHGEIDKLRNEIGANEQILVRVEMVEVSLTKLRKLGVDFATLGQGTSIQRLDQLRQAFKVAGAGHNADELDLKSLNGPSSFVEWLKENNIAKVLARPNMVVVNGRPATMFVGTELPTPAVGDTKTIQFQKCGTEVSVLAVARDHEHVRLELRARVSEPDDSRSIGVEGSRVPAMRVRECDTAVETSFGEPVIVDGTVENRAETSISVNGVVETPNEIALLIVATPERVESKKPADSQHCPCNDHAGAPIPSCSPECIAVAVPLPIAVEACCASCNSNCQQNCAQAKVASGHLPQYRLQFCMFQVSLSQLDKIGVALPAERDSVSTDELSALQAAIEKAIVTSQGSSHPLAQLAKTDLNGILDWLGQYDAVRILADPTIVATSGREASYSSLHGPKLRESDGKGGIKPCQAGVSIDCTATQKSADLIQVSLDFKKVDPWDNDPSEIQNLAIPNADISQSVTTVSFADNKPVLLGGLCQRVVSSEETSDERTDRWSSAETLLALTAIRIDSMRTATADSPGGNQSACGTTAGGAPEICAMPMQQPQACPCNQRPPAHEDSSVTSVSGTDAEEILVVPALQILDATTPDQE